jgi:hypothetical protein
MASAARTRALLACGMAVLCPALVVARAGPAMAQGDGSGNTNPSVTVPAEVRELWREYPLEPTAPPASPRQSRSGERSTEPRSAGSADSDSGPIPVGIAVAIGAAVVALLALALFLLPRLAWTAESRLTELRPGAPPLRRRRVRRTQRTTADRSAGSPEATLGIGPPGPEHGSPPGQRPLPAEPEDGNLELGAA